MKKKREQVRQVRASRAPACVPIGISGISFNGCDLWPQQPGVEEVHGAWRTWEYGGAATDAGTNGGHRHGVGSSIQLNPQETGCEL